jgi:putative flavoprotein involved in K+ transport
LEKLSIDTIIIGAGQAGLATSYHLTKQGKENLVLEKADIPGHVWRDERWDSFNLVVPNWSFQLPGAEYHGTDPDGFLPRDEIVDTFRQYAEKYHFPIRSGVAVSAVEPHPAGKGYLVCSQELEFQARNVIVATGMHQDARIPFYSTALPPEITQLPSSEYRNPEVLPPGAVLVVGSAQSGSQITEELYRSGRQVYLCVGKSGRVPRRYRGKDIFTWLMLTGFIDRTPDMLPDPKLRFLGSAAVSGRDGGRTLNLHQFARDGVQLLGRLQGFQDNTLSLAPDLHQNLAFADQFEVDIIKVIDGYIEAKGLGAPKERLPELRDGYQQKEIAAINLKTAGITSLIWAAGFTHDFSLVKLPVTDSYGFPITQRGATSYPGLYFVGLPWLHKWKSGFLFGVGEDATHIASLISGSV